MVVLDVGQGSGNFVEIYADVGNPAAERLVSTILADFGSDHVHLDTGSGPASVQYIYNRLMTMAVPTLDMVILSHGDADHVVLLYTLLGKFKPRRSTDVSDPRPVLTILGARYCGAQSDYNHKKRPKWEGTQKPPKGNNILTWITNYMPPDVPAVDDTPAVVHKPRPFANDASTIAGWVTGDGRRDPFAVVGEARLYAVKGNVNDALTRVGLKRKKLNAYAVNTKSLVLLLDYRGEQFVLTGDATGLTLQECNTLLTDEIRDEYLPNVLMATFPHHGAMATGFGLAGNASRRGDNTEGVANMTTFANKVRAKTVTGSAERKSTFKHPDIRVVDCFTGPLAPAPYWTDVTAGAGRHYFTAYYEYACGYTRADTGKRWPTAGTAAGWYSLQTAANVYTTLYYVNAKARALVYPPSPLADGEVLPRGAAIPPEGQRWTYTVRAQNDVTLQPTLNRGQPVRKSVVPAPGGPVPAGPVVTAAIPSAPRTIRIPGLTVVP
jgi:hypothetical protein